ncbi:PhzF family phenazine biosynthesis isomerase [Halomonas mongoliensis]|uniref:PhzF family phenazine biosynthesis isomerase n=1 Tax=Halomonas mongoliensis TaxID=321265 RepID=A0ABU1GK96_9GAMM|nr:PhzF family phenazine biosynthesis isomerase [Halomonas mongoliensis]MDR5892429.1 PhzF family phenazine biosynthesis isomerase [Halomonas mongoliensis]
MTDYFLLDVFTDRAFSGNPLAVFPYAEGLASGTMQAIANELNLSETVFVGEAAGQHRYPIRIFTPTRELPFAGHPVIGTAHLLVELGMAKHECPLVLEAGVGPLVVEFDQVRARLTTAEPVSILSSTLPRASAAELLGLAGYLAQNRGAGRWQIEQGIEMGRPSRILAEADRTEDDLSIRIAGEAVIVGSGTLHLPGGLTVSREAP